MSHLDRRQLLRYGAAATIVSATAAGAQALQTPGSAAEVPAATPPTDKDSRDFDTEYRGKRIKGVHNRRNKKHKVTINGKKLAVVEIELPGAEGSTATVVALLSAMTHFEPFLLDDRANRDGLLKMVQKAVENLGGNELTDLAGETHDHGR